MRPVKKPGFRDLWPAAAQRSAHPRAALDVRVCAEDDSAFCERYTEFQTCSFMDPPDGALKGKCRWALAALHVLKPLGLLSVIRYPLPVIRSEGEWQ